MLFQGQSGYKPTLQINTIKVVQMRQDLLRYKHILSADDHYCSWQEVEAECKEDPEGLALQLASKGAVSAALEVAESAGLSIDLRRELKGRQLVKLLIEDPLNGGGPAEASRFLSSLRDTDDALPVAMGAMQLLPNLRSKQLLAIVFYEFAFHFNPHCAEACNNLGVIYKDCDNLDKAVECYQAKL
ncbi:putative UDP-N-acetylglucosamine--peptide N-acetylglucosaminyltransferase SPINDLY [Camellia lanceoleosa]|uniref:UDP-N-acetylglucosamine--peptide N-acetylglucosaminyltransferase SPINDLY n=1 Tax=Camellia lanceoleosa TaxID=1840588 RepID=A0ACC0HTK0_9ERIC|nr:putative UDP-N-acetylglucosamine--peptide N-acetylglucosaminyltransferase SPINDLY [Camellia lanceoleosa]